MDCCRTGVTGDTTGDVLAAALGAARPVLTGPLFTPMTAEEGDRADFVAEGVRLRRADFP